MKKLTLTLFILIFIPLYTFSQSNHMSLAKVKKGKKFGYIDGEANLIIPVEYDTLGEFNEGLVTAKKKDEWSILDIEGNIVLELGNRYKYVGQFGSGLCFVTNDAKYSSRFSDKPRLDIDHNDIRFINLKGEEVFVLHDSIPRWIEDFRFFKFHNGFLKLPYASEYGFVNKKGELVIPQTFHRQYDGFEDEFYDGLALVANQRFSQFIDKNNPDFYGFIDTTGKWALEPTFSFGYHFENGFAKIDSCWIEDYKYCTSRLIDKNGKSVFPEDIWISDYREGTGYLSVGKKILGQSKYALAKTDGTYITGFKYKKITAPFSNGNFMAKKGRRSGVLTKEGKWFRPVKNKNYDRYDYLIGLIRDKDDYYLTCFIDMDGKVILPFKKRGFMDIEGGIIKERTSGSSWDNNETYAYYSRKGELLDLSEYDEVGEFQWVLVEKN